MMLRITKRLCDKEIGFRIITNRFYNVKPNDWDVYNSSISNTYSRNFTQNKINYSINDILMDTVSKQNEDIKNVKTDILNLYSRVNELNNNFNKNHKQIEEIFMLFSDIIEDINIINSKLPSNKNKK
jgi:hypothetical protein